MGDPIPDPAYQIVAEWVSRHTGVALKDLHPETPLEDALGDKLDLVEFVMHVEDRLGLEMPETDYESPPETLGDLATLVRLGREY